MLRGASGRAYGVRSDAAFVGFDVYDLGEAGRRWADPQLIVRRRGVWTDLYIEDIGVYYKQATVVVRALNPTSDLQPRERRSGVAVRHYHARVLGGQWF